MEKIKVVILEGGNTAKEVNPFGKPEIIKEINSEHWAVIRDLQNSHLNQWQEAESKLRTFEIELHENTWPSCCYESGKIFEAEVINDKQIRIL